MLIYNITCLCADAVLGSPGRQYQKNQYNNRPELIRSHTPWARGPSNFQNKIHKDCRTRLRVEQLSQTKKTKM